MQLLFEFGPDLRTGAVTDEDVERVDVRDRRVVVDEDR